MKYQFTVYNSENKYRPITVTLTPRPHEKVQSLKRRAVEKICIERGWGIHELMYKYKYTSCKHRFIKEDE